MACKQPGRSHMGRPALLSNLDKIISVFQVCQGHDAQLTMCS